MKILIELGLAVGILAALHPLAAQEEPAKRPIELQDYFRLESAGSPAISPDGRTVALVRSYVDRETDRTRNEIWLVPSDASTPPRRITSPAFNSSAPSWSVDGKLLSFVSSRPGPDNTPGAGDVWFLRIDQAGEAFRIPGVGGRPLFSPNNRWIAFTRRTRPEPAPALATASHFERELAQHFEGIIFDWIQYRFDRRGYLPDPRDPAATPPQELYLVARDGGDPKQLTSLGVDVQDAAWAPDSRSLALVADEHQRDEYSYERSDLWIVTLDGSLHRLTDDGYDHGAVAWSPDGNLITFQRRMGLDMVIAAGAARGSPVDLYLMPANGGPMRNLTADWDLIPGAPTFSVDGRFVYFSAGIGGESHLFRVPTADGGVQQVTRGARITAGFAYSMDGERIAYTASDATRPTEVFSAHVDGTDETQLTDFNKTLLAEIVLTPAQRLRFPSSDGTPIEGWIMQPDTSSTPHPLILSIHGGPHGAYGEQFNFFFQLMAARGYAVAFTNPRGSTGYGDDFLWATWGAWGDLDTQDVLAGVDHVVERYPIDRSRMGVTGYSYGGFLTNWIITQDRRFVAAVSGAGISNWVSDWATSDIPRTKESEFFGPPWTERGARHLLRQSPIMHAAGVTTPTLFVHGESDYRVPIEQAEQMYLALRKQRVPARFVRYPETSHGAWTLWNTVHRYDQTLRWWDDYLRSQTP